VLVKHMVDGVGRAEPRGLAFAEGVFAACNFAPALLGDLARRFRCDAGADGQPSPLALDEIAQVVAEAPGPLAFAGEAGELVVNQRFALLQLRRRCRA
jgi:hypothetical protein